MKVLLIQPTVVLEGGQLLKKEKCDVMPCLGLLAVAACTPQDIEVKIIEECYRDLDFDAECDLVGLSSMTHCIWRAYEISRQFRQRGKKVVIGGWHASLFANEVLEHCDAVVVGEAEGAWSRVIEDFRRGRMEGCYCSDDLADVTTLLTPRMDLLDSGTYENCMWPVQTSRGCPNRCQYCCINKLFRGRYRVFPTRDVIRNIENCPAKNIQFVDDNLVVNVKRTEELFNAVIPLGIRWTSSADIRIARQPKILNLFKRSGCNSLNIGLESINQNALDGVGKKFNRVEEYAESLKIISEAGIDPTINFMFGFEEDHRDVFARTMEFIDKNEPVWAHFTILTPTPGSPLWDKLTEENRIFDRNWSHFDGMHVVFEPQNMTAEELERNYWKMHRKYLSYRRILKRCLRNGADNFLTAWRFNTAIRKKFKKLKEAIYF